MNGTGPVGFLVAIEGIDGSGKTTQAGLLAKFCSENRLECIVSKEPTNGQYGSLIRDSAARGRRSVEEEIELLLKDRAEHVERVINPALKEAKIIVLDRYYFSMAAYQGARGADPELILTENERFAPQPDLLIVLDISPQVGLGRIKDRGDQPNKFETVESLEGARSIFKEIQRPYKHEIDAAEGIDLVWTKIERLVQSALRTKLHQRTLPVAN
jgi:dTMP kinase